MIETGQRAHPLQDVLPPPPQRFDISNIKVQRWVLNYGGISSHYGETHWACRGNFPVIRVVEYALPTCQCGDELKRYEGDDKPIDFEYTTVFSEFCRGMISYA